MDKPFPAPLLSAVAAGPSAAHCGLLLAAGRGSRFDPAGIDNKLLARLPGSELLVVEATARQMLQVVPVLAVVGSSDSELARRLAALGCTLAVCEQAAAGMSASLMCGVRQAADAAGWIIALADMPFVQSTTYSALLAALHDRAELAVPTYAGQRGNPVAFSRQHRNALLQLSGDRGARQLLQQYPVLEIAVNDPGILRDIDTRADLAQV